MDVVDNFITPPSFQTCFRYRYRHVSPLYLKQPKQVFF